MLASLEDIYDYDVTVRPEVLAEVRASDACSLCGVEPLSSQSSYAKTLAWLDANDTVAGDKMRTSVALETETIEYLMGSGRSGGNLDLPTRWLEYRQKHAHDSKLYAGYAISVVVLQIAMARLDQDQRDFLGNVFVVAICDICSTRLDDSEDLFLRSYVAQWAGGNIAVARAQKQWPDIEHIAELAVSAFKSNTANG